MQSYVAEEACLWSCASRSHAYSHLCTSVRTLPCCKRYQWPSHPPKDHLACGLSVCLQKAGGRRFKCRFFGTLVYELSAGQVGTGFAWKLYTCCAAATRVFGTRVAPGLHPGTPTGVNFFFFWTSHQHQNALCDQSVDAEQTFKGQGRNAIAGSTCCWRWVYNCPSLCCCSVPCEI